MAMDGIAVAAVAASLRRELILGRVDKITQPSRDEINITVRAGGKNKKLLITSNAASPRVHLTETAKENPSAAPLFCMVLRKHLAGGRILSVEQLGFERVINITVESATEMGDITRKIISAEIMGKHSNVILTESGVILDSIKRVGIEESSLRQVLPGLPYCPPPPQGKKNPLELTESAFAESAAESDMKKFLLGSFTGISPVMAEEICFRADGDIYGVFAALMADVKGENFAPEIVVNEAGKLIEFAAVPLTKFGEGYARQKFSDINEVLERFYAGRDLEGAKEQKTRDLRKVLSANMERLTKKIDIHNKTLSDSANRETKRLYGELLTANIYAIKRGADKFECVNFYDEAGGTVTIPLDVNKTAAENAQSFFKRYNKEKRAAAAAVENIKIAEEELRYLDGVSASVAAAVDTADVDEIRSELAEQGFIKKRAAKGIKPKKSKPLEFGSDGFVILVGKSNTQNDELTKTAEPTDIWLHTKEIPGSHVIIKTNGTTPPNAVIEQAASLAAHYSKARESSIVPVDYCPRKNVKKPNGARPGFVIYENYKTAYVKPKD